jgi:hypothetical protein
MDDVPLSPDLPQEDELALASMGALSFFNCFYFPKDISKVFAEAVLFHGVPQEAVSRWSDDFHYYLAKLSILHGGRRLLLKNPAHSARIPMLSSLFPTARFIHVHRDPRDVIPSTRKLYRTMLERVALQDFDMTAVERHIEWSYPVLMDALFGGLKALPAERHIDVAYDDLVREPLSVVQSIYQAFGLSGFGRCRESMQSMVLNRVHTVSKVDVSDAAFGERMATVAEKYRGRLGYGLTNRSLESQPC